VRIDPEELKRHYSSLSDRALLALHREDLTDFAQQVYDAEILHRGLRARVMTPRDETHGELIGEDSDDLGETRHLHIESVPWAKDAVAAHVFQSAPEAEEARDALEEANIPCALAGDEAPQSFRFKLMVPKASLEAAKSVLDAKIFHPVFEDTLDRHFARFTDAELLAVDPELLPPLARAAFLEELRERELKSEFDLPEEAPAKARMDGLVSVATLFPKEAEIAKQLLEESGISCVLEEDPNPTPMDEYQGVHLLVTADEFDEASSLLEQNATQIMGASDEQS
jgi:hypothetical protein